MNDLINYQELAMNWLKTTNSQLSQSQMEEFIMFCKMYKLNPWLKEAYPIAYGGKLQLVTNYLIICARAKQNPKYYREVIEYYQNGERINHPHLTPAMRGVVIAVNIYDKNNTLISNYDFDVDEYASAIKGGFKDTHYNSWAQKCAITNALRRTFPAEVEGLYIPEEMDQPDASVEATKPKKHPAVATTFKNVLTELAKLEADGKTRVAVIREYCQTHNTTEKDLADGNFDVGDIMEFINNKYPQQPKIEEGENK